MREGEFVKLRHYNGYYSGPFKPLLVAYPGTKNIKAAINYGDDIWVIADLDEEDTASISIREKAKYLKIQETSNLQYSDDREDYPDDEAFANFRSVTAGDIKENVLYRSASPCDNKHNRASCTDGLAEKVGIRCIVDLADSDKKKKDILLSTILTRRILWNCTKTAVSFLCICR